MLAPARPALTKWLRRMEIVIRRERWLPRIEWATFAVALIVGISSYLILVGGQPGQKLLAIRSSATSGGVNNFWPGCPPTRMR